MVLTVAAVGLGLAGFAAATAQDATPGTGAPGTPCASPAASPVAMASPMIGLEGTPTSAEGCPPAGVAEIAVEIRDFAYDPDPATVALGGTVTWTNRDVVPHTATARGDREVLQSGALSEGESYSRTFEEAGTYEYYCEFHAGMRGTVVVE